MHVESGGAGGAWNIVDFELPKHFNIAILANKTAMTHQ